MDFVDVRLFASAAVLPDLREFHGERLGVERIAETRFRVGATELEFAPSQAEPFYHFALLVPGNRFDAAFDWIRERVELLPYQETGEEVFDFDNWNALACYFHDPAGNIVELIAHRGIGETDATGAFSARELLGFSELGLVGDPRAMARDLELVGLRLWDGTLDEPGTLAFVGEQARTLILSPEGRGWLPTGRPAESHPVEVALSGSPEGTVSVNGHLVSRRV